MTRRKWHVILAIVCVVCSTLATALLFASLLTSSWIKIATGREIGLWYSCSADNCITSRNVPEAGWLLVVFCLCGFVALSMYVLQFAVGDSAESVVILSTVLFGITGLGILIGVYSFIIEQPEAAPSTIGWSMKAAVAAALSYLTAMIVSCVAYCCGRHYTRDFK